MVSGLVSNVVDRGFDPRSSQTKDYNICTWCSPVNHVPLRSKCQYILFRIQDNVSDCGNMYTRGLLFQWGIPADYCFSDVYPRTIVSVMYTRGLLFQWGIYQNAINHVGLVQNRHRHLLSEILFVLLMIKCDKLLILTIIFFMINRLINVYLSFPVYVYWKL